MIGVKILPFTLLPFGGGSKQTFIFSPIAWYILVGRPGRAGRRSKTQGQVVPVVLVARIKILNFDQHYL
jgi:hypothetical protein